jgi:hypothetical protein
MSCKSTPLNDDALRQIVAQPEIAVKAPALSVGYGPSAGHATARAAAASHTHDHGGPPLASVCVAPALLLLRSPLV